MTLSGGGAPPRVRFVGDAALAVEFEDRIDPLVNARVQAFASHVRAARVDGISDVVVGYRSATIYLDPLRTDVTRLMTIVEDAARAAPPALDADRPVRVVPVRYGAGEGPDLDEVAALTGCTAEEVVAAHTGTIYRVYMMGFVPGFPYLGILPERIRVPRRTEPRLRTPAGSVAIADAQTGIYPAETPGGWRVIGHTDIVLFDPSRRDPFWLRAGDRVRFVDARREVPPAGGPA